jgi:hypothetical protein
MIALIQQKYASNIRNGTIKGLTWHGCQVTIAEGITRISIGTGASWSVVDHGAQSINAAGSGTGIPALFSDTSFIAGAIRIDRAFGAAIWR